MFGGISEVFIQMMMNLLDTLKTFTGSYGWSIVIFAALVKIALYYPTQRQYESMKEMQKVQPLLKKLQVKYKDDQQKLQVEQMALFKKYNINPLGGCLPLIIQMPILIGIFMTIRKMAELGKFSGEVFLWIGGPLSKTYPDWFGASLAVRDVPLLLIYAASMYFSQKMTVSDPSAEKTQQMMSTMMPILFTFFMWKFPSSLILYWLVFNILSIIQQYFIMKKTKSPENALSTDTGEIAMDDDIGEDISSENEGSSSRSRKKKRRKSE